MSRLRSTIALAALLAFSATAGAQHNRRSTVPARQMPPTGMCRVWIDGLAVNRQRAPTDCATARAQAGVNSRVLYGRNLDTDQRGTGPWGIGRGTNDSRTQRDIDKAERKRDREIAKANRKRDMEWKHGGKHGDDDGDDEGDDDDERGDRELGQRGRHDDRDDDRVDDRDDDRDGRGRGGINSCIDANRDGRCDISTSTGIQLPRILRP